MVTIQVRYEGQLRCAVVHGPSGAELCTDAPTDNQGRGESFSPTDLLATSLGTCMLTIMGIVAERKELDLAGSEAKVVKHMVADPLRRIGRLEVDFRLPGGFAPQHRELLEKAARSCPVAQSISTKIDVALSFGWGQGA